MDVTRDWHQGEELGLASWQVRVVVAIGEERVDVGEVPKEESAKDVIASA